MAEQSAIGVMLSSCVIGVDCSRRSADVGTATTSQRADPSGLHGLSNTRINPTSVSYFLLSPDLQIILPLLELIFSSPKQHSVLLVPYFNTNFHLGGLDIYFGWELM